MLLRIAGLLTHAAWIWWKLAWGRTCKYMLNDLRQRWSNTTLS